MVDLLEYDIKLPNPGKIEGLPSHRLKTYRPFLTTTNTEFWGGGKCQRYDIVYDTVIGRNWHGCIGIHSPPAYWYEGMRVDNHTYQLMLPETETEKESYAQGIIDMKDADKFHTLFLVKYCYVPDRYPADVMVRVLFFDLLRERYLNVQSNQTDR